MNPKNKIDYKTFNLSNLDITGDMSYYIDYACKLYYPNFVEIKKEDSETIAVKVYSDSIISSYIINVYFDDEGKFKWGLTEWDYDWIGKMMEKDQFKFKQKIKKEINKVNVIHGTSRALMQSK